MNRDEKITAEPKRVLMLFTIMDRGGAETMIMNYYRKTDRSKLQFDFIVHRDKPGFYDEEIRRMGGRIFVFPPVKPSRFGEYKQKIWTFLDDHPEYTIIHSHCQELSYYFYKIAYKKGIPYIISHSHNASMLWDYKAPLRILWRKLMFKYINIYFTCGIEAARHYYGTVRSRKAIVMPNAIETEKFSFRKKWRENIRKEWGVSENTFIVGHIGRFTPQKNHRKIIMVFKSIIAKQRNAQLALVGGGEDMEAVQKMVSDNGLEKSVRFLGLRQDIPQLLSAFDCILMPSLFEGVSVAMIEEQASGLPIVTSTNVPAEVGLLESTERLPLVASDNEWADAVLKYRGRARNSDAATEVAAAGYDIEKNVIWLQNYYLSLN